MKNVGCLPTLLSIAHVTIAVTVGTHYITLRKYESGASWNYTYFHNICSVLGRAKKHLEKVSNYVLDSK
jgi:hypothetical protein